MSVFSIFRRGRHRAKGHSQGQAEKRQEEDAQPAHKPVPTHATVDGLAGASSIVRADDESKTADENKRRSVMPGITVVRSREGLPRPSSGLSRVSYPAAHANPMVTAQRPNYYRGPQQRQGAQSHRMSAGAGYPALNLPQETTSTMVPSLKGKEMERGFTPRSSRTLPLTGDKRESQRQGLPPGLPHPQLSAVVHVLIVQFRGASDCELEKLSHSSGRRRLGIRRRPYS